MSGRVCYIGRRDGGDRVTEVRLIGARGEESWRPADGGASDSMAVMDEAAQAAAWIASRSGRTGLSLLVVDVGGSECRWVTSPGTEPQVVAAAIAHAEDWGESHLAAGSWGAPTVAEASVQALAPGKAMAGGGARAVGAAVADAGLRVGALAISDVSARLLVDALDDRGVAVERAVSLWHAMALAWDSPPPESERGDVVARNAGVVGVLMIDPAGRLLWAWSRAGELLAGGAVRLPLRAGVQVAAPDVGRLTADWLSWSVQLGCAPSRIIVLSPSLETGPDALSPAQVGTALGQGWAGATVDLAVHEDPIGATMARLAGVVDDRPEPVSAEDGRQSLLMLSQRPGRAHRAMYRWLALALLIGAVALGAVAVKAWQGAGAANAEARAARESLRAIVTEEVLPANADVMQRATAEDAPRLYLEQRIADLRRALNPTGGLEPAKPILAELDALSYVLGYPELKITDIQLNTGGALVTVEVPDTATGEALIQSMQSVSGSSVAEWLPQWQQQSPGSSRRSLLLTGRWAAESAAAPSEGGQP